MLLFISAAAILTIALVFFIRSWIVQIELRSERLEKALEQNKIQNVLGEQ